MNLMIRRFKHKQLIGISTALFRIYTNRCCVLHLCLGLMILFLSSVSNNWAQPFYKKDSPQKIQQQTLSRVLSGGISKTERIFQVCTICQARTLSFINQHNGQPLRGATIFIPQWGYRAQTDQQGQIGIPNDVIQAHSQPHQFRQTIIGNIQQEGYVPESFLIQPTLLLNAQRGQIIEFSAPRRLTIQHQRLLLDNQLHHLGDDDFSQRSSGASQFKSRSEGPVYTRHFTYHPTLDQKTVLHIGSLTGLDTLEAHAALRKFKPNNQTQTEVNTYGSPAQVWLNGILIGRLTLNGQDIVLPLPQVALNQNGQQTLQIKAGHNQFKTDIDDMEWMTLWIESIESSN